MEGKERDEEGKEGEGRGEEGKTPQTKILTTLSLAKIESIDEAGTAWYRRTTWRITG